MAEGTVVSHKVISNMVSVVGYTLGQSYLSKVKWPNKVLSRCADT